MKKIINRKEMMVMVLEAIKTGQTIGAVCIMMPAMKWTKTLKCSAGLPKNWGFARYFEGVRQNVIVHQKSKGQVSATTAHIANSKIDRGNDFTKKYHIVFLMNDFLVEWTKFKKDNPEMVNDTTAEGQVKLQQAKEKIGNKYYRNLNLETVRVLKTKKQTFWVSDADIPNQYLSEDKTNSYTFV